MAFYPAFEYYDLTDESGVAQAGSLLLGAYQAGLELNELN